LKHVKLRIGRGLLACWLDTWGARRWKYRSYLTPTSYQNNFTQRSSTPAA
jgi:hypothetical protein